MSIPTVAPSRITKGTTAKWIVALSDYSPADSALVYNFSCPTAAHSVTATDYGDGRFLVTIPASGTGTSTDDFTAGVYAYQALVTKDGEVTEVFRGQVTILPSLSAAVDSRSHVKKTLDAIEALIDGKASRSDVAQYSVGTGNGSRSLAYVTPEELVRWRAIYRAEYQRELRAERLASGLGSSRKVRVRFV